ncbi:MAG: c-type cytochrome [Desulfobacterales bacterium]
MFNQVYEFLDKLGYSHPIHPTEVHMPIGLVVASVLFIYIAVIFRRRSLEQTVRHCIILAFIWIFPTILFGYMDWQHFYAGAWLFPIRVKLATAAGLTLLLLLSVIVAHRRGPASKAAVTLYTVCFLAVVVLGYFGGQLVYGVKTSAISNTYGAGRKIFKTNCSACHPNGTNVIMPNLPLKGSSKLNHPDTFIDFLRKPVLPDGKAGPMPAFPAAKISDPEVKELYDYITHVLVT